MSYRILLLGLSVLGSTWGAAAAQDAPFVDEDGTWSLVVENDWFGSTDRNYTNGLRLAYLSGTKEPDFFARFFADRLAAEDAVVRRGFALGHSIYTPEDTDATVYLPDQHPYAGHLYGEYSAVIQQRDQIDQFTLQLGVVGPSAGGESLQNNVHKAIGGDTANGWDNQIPDTAAVSLSWDRQMRRLAEFGIGDLGVDVTPSVGVTAGTVHVNARAGLMVRLGSDLRNDFGPPRIRPSLAGGGFFTPSDNFSWYAFAGVQGRAVAHDLFLDGAWWRDDDPDVASKTFVSDSQLGFVTQFGRTQIAYTYVHRTESFETQDGPQQFGAVSLSWKY